MLSKVESRPTTNDTDEKKIMINYIVKPNDPLIVCMFDQIKTSFIIISREKHWNRWKKRVGDEKGSHAVILSSTQNCARAMSTMNTC